MDDVTKLRKLGSKSIRLTQGKVALVSHHRFDELNAVKWYAWKDPNTGRFYAVRHGPSVGGVSHRIYMHRQILGLEYGDPRTGDHRDRRRTLDNTDGNLRIASKGEQVCNQGKRRNNKSGYKGVCWHKPMQKWVAQICVNRKRMVLGYRSTAAAAHFELYVPAAKKYHKSFAMVD
jgi:AP2 domain